MSVGIEMEKSDQIELTLNCLPSSYWKLQKFDQRLKMRMK